MRIAGNEVKRPSRKLRLDSGQEVTVTAPPLGIFQRAVRIVPAPTPPQKICRVKDESQYVENKSDPAYRARMARVTHLQSVFVAWEILRTDPQIRFDTPVPTDGPDLSFIEQVAQELEPSLTEGDVKRLLSFAANSAQPVKEELDAAEGFSAA